MTFSHLLNDYGFTPRPDGTFRALGVLQGSEVIYHFSEEESRHYVSWIIDGEFASEVVTYGSSERVLAAIFDSLTWKGGESN